MKKPPSDKRRLREFFRAETAGRRATAPACRHFGACGGCEFQDVPYADQLEAKRRAFPFILAAVSGELRERAAKPGEGDRGKVAPDRRADVLESAFAGRRAEIVASPSPYGYRQRMDYVYAFGRAGLRRAGRRRQVVELEECPLLGSEGFAAFRLALAAAQDAGLESYDYVRHTGELRYFVVRRSRRGDVLLSLVTKSRQAGPRAMAVLSGLLGRNAIASGHWLVAEGLGDVSFGVPAAGAGAPCICETVNGIELGIGPNTFFQANPAIAEIAYARIRDFVPEGGTALDMYSGVGSIALTLAAKAGAVVAAENNPDNVLLARRAVAASGMDNVEIAEIDAVRHLVATAKAGDRPGTVVVNPPRPGVGGGGLEAIRRIGPRRLAYLSCNPFSLLRDLAELLDMYGVASLTLFDMFPQTGHFETLALLERKE